MSDIPNSNIAEAKAALRKVAQVKRARVRAATAGDCRRLLIGRASDILDQCNLAEGAVVAGYYPINDEIDCLGLLAALRDLGRSIALPKMRGAGQALDFYDWRASTKLEKGAFGIMEPALGPDCNSTSVLPDLVLLPLWRLTLRVGVLVMVAVIMTGRLLRCAGKAGAWLSGLAMTSSKSIWCPGTGMISCLIISSRRRGF